MACIKNSCKTHIIFFTIQLFILLIVIIISLVNITFNFGNSYFWTIILTNTLSYMMPNPKLKTCKFPIKDVINNN